MTTESIDQKCQKLNTKSKEQERKGWEGETTGTKLKDKLDTTVNNSYKNAENRAGAYRNNKKLSGDLHTSLRMERESTKNPIRKLSLTARDLKLSATDTLDAGKNAAARKGGQLKRGTALGVKKGVTTVDTQVTKARNSGVGKKLGVDTASSQKHAQNKALRLDAQSQYRKNKIEGRKQKRKG